MLIDCETCAARPSACSGCVMTVLLRPEVDVDLDPSEQAAVAVLADAGLVAPLRMAPLRQAAGQ